MGIVVKPVKPVKMTQPNWKIWEKLKEKFALTDEDQAKKDWEMYSSIFDTKRDKKKRAGYRKSSPKGRLK